MAAESEIDVLLVCSAGGHLLQLYLLRDAWDGRRTAWVTHDKDDARSLLAGADVSYAYGPTVRSVGNLVRNLGLAWRVLRARRPRVIVTTGAAVAVPFVWLGAVLGCKIVWIESLTRIERPSLSGRLVRPFVDRWYAQWPELAGWSRRVRHAGAVVPR